MTLGSWTPLFLITCVAACASAEDGPPAAAVSFDRDVQPILRKRCAGCHNAEKPRGELDVTTYAAVVTGGATGKVALAHNPNESLLYTFASHIEEPYMPPNAPRIPQRELDLIRGWIEGGLVEKPGEAVHSSSGPAAGTTPGSPEGGLVSPTVTPRAFAITAVAVHPSDQTLAVSAHKQVILFDLSTRKLFGALAFPEGDVFALRFSRDGRALLAAGGVGAESGKAVLFETKSWTRTQTLGDELDSVLAADLSPDGAMVVLGGPSRVVKVFTNPDGTRNPFVPQVDRLGHCGRRESRWITDRGWRSVRRAIALGSSVRPGVLDAPRSRQGGQRHGLGCILRSTRDMWRRRQHPDLGPAHRQCCVRLERPRWRRSGTGH